MTTYHRHFNGRVCDQDCSWPDITPVLVLDATDDEQIEALARARFDSAYRHTGVGDCVLFLLLTWFVNGR